MINEQENDYAVLEHISVYLMTSTKADLYDNLKKLKASVMSTQFIKDLFEQMPEELTAVFREGAEEVFGEKILPTLINKFVSTMTTFQFFYDEKRELLGCFRTPIRGLSDVFQAHFDLAKDDEEHFDNELLFFSPKLKEELQDPTYKQMYDIVIGNVAPDNIISIAFFDLGYNQYVFIEEMKRLCEEKYGDSARKD